MKRRIDRLLWAPIASDCDVGFSRTGFASQGAVPPATSATPVLLAPSIMLQTSAPASTAICLPSPAAPAERAIAAIIATPSSVKLAFDPSAWEHPLGLSAGLWAGISMLLALGWLIAVAAAMLKRRKQAKGVRGDVPMRTQAPLSSQATGMSIANLHHPGTRDKQEDSFAISDISNTAVLHCHGLLAVVADGMGGLERGEAVSAAVTGTMLRLFSELPAVMTPPQKLLYLTQQANEEACRISGGRPNQSGSTLTAALLQKNDLWFVSVGDSRISLFRNHAAIQLNREHIYAANLDQSAARGSIAPLEALSDSQRGALTSYVGMPELSQVDFSLSAVRLVRNDWVLLMSDGVFHSLTDDEIAAQLHGSVYEAAARIEAAVLRKQSANQDNFTAILFKII